MIWINLICLNFVSVYKAFVDFGKVFYMLQVKNLVIPINYFLRFRFREALEK